MIQVKTEFVGGVRLRLFCEYSQELLRRVRAVGGKWQTTHWEFPMESGLRLVKKHFGVSEETVRVRVRCCSTTEFGWEEPDSFAMLGGYVLASRRHRDDPVTFREDLVVGSVPASGGSVKNPKVYLSEDAEFELDVRKDFAEAHGLKIIPGLPNASETHPEKELGPTDEQLFLALDILLKLIDLPCEWLMQGGRNVDEERQSAYELGLEVLQKLKARIAKSELKPVG